MGEPEQTQDVVRQLRAVLITVVLLVTAAEALPIPRISARVMQAESNQRELLRWSERLTNLGYAITKPELEREVVALSARFGAVHHELSAPARLWLSPIAATQRWALFPVVDDQPWWLHVESRTSLEGPFELVFRPHDDEHVFQERLAYRRVRGAWNPGTSGPRYDYRGFVRFIAAEIFESDPNAVEVRVRYARRRINRPGLPERDTTTRWFHEERVRRL